MGRRQDRFASVSAIKLNFHRLRDNPIALQVSDQLLSRGSRHSGPANNRQDRNANGFLKKWHRTRGRDGGFVERLVEGTWAGHVVEHVALELQRTAGHEITRGKTRSTGEDGVWMAGENEYDAVVLDVMLPGIDGFEVSRRMRVGERWAPVIMLTARDAVQDRVRGLDAGADDYLTKPFSISELRARLRALIRRGTPERPPVLRVGDLELDPAAHTVRRGEVPVELTAKEFALLEFLMHRPGEVLSRTQLIEHVWDFAFEGDSNVVDVYVRYLREKIDRPFGRRSLETVRGSGYRLRDEVARASSDQA